MKTILFDRIEIFGIPALFTEERLGPRDYLPSLFRYDLRHGDDGVPETVEPYVVVNFAGTVLLRQSLDFHHRTYRSLHHGRDLNFTGRETTIEIFMEEKE